MQHALAPRSSGAARQAATSDLDHAPVVGKPSRVGPSPVGAATTSEEHHRELVARITRELAAIATAALPAFERATRQVGRDPIAHRLEVMRAAHRVQHMEMTANHRIRALLAARPQDPQAREMRTELDQLIARATRLGVDRAAGATRSRTDRSARGTTGPAAIETPGHKEPGWIKPATGVRESAPQVGAVFFRTKEHAVDAGDRTRFLELAKRYASSARSGLGTRAGAAGLKGRVIGYADPRRTRKPDNDQLSHLRADAVATELGWALALETRLGIERFRFERIGAGVAPGAPEGAEAAAEGNTLAPYRRRHLPRGPRVGRGGRSMGWRPTSMVRWTAASTPRSRTYT